MLYKTFTRDSPELQGENERDNSSATQDSDLESSLEPISLDVTQNIPEDETELPPGAIVSGPLSRFEHLNLAEFPDDSFVLELTESREISSFIAVSSVIIYSNTKLVTKHLNSRVETRG